MYIIQTENDLLSPDLDKPMEYILLKITTVRTFLLVLKEF